MGPESPDRQGPESPDRQGPDRLGSEPRDGQGPYGFCLYDVRLGPVCLDDVLLLTVPPGWDWIFVIFCDFLCTFLGVYVLLSLVRFIGYGPLKGVSFISPPYVLISSRTVY